MTTNEDAPVTLVVAGASALYPGCPATVDAAIADGRSLRQPRWGLWDVLIMMVGTVGVAAVVGLALPSVSGDNPPGAPLLLAVVAPWLALAGWPILATWWRGNGARIDLGLRLTWSDVGRGAVGGLLAWLVLAVVAVAMMAVTGDFTSAAGEAAVELLRDGNRLVILGFAVAVVVGAPVVEEIAFRGLLFNSLRKRGLSSTWTIVITAVAFACFHFEPIRLPILLGMGLVLGILRSRTSALGAPIVAHMLVNAPGAIFILQGMPGMAP